jgi:cation transport ATPase
MQRQQERKQHRRRWRMSVGEWVIMLLNPPLAFLSGGIGLFATFDTERLTDYLLGGTFFLVALGAGLTSLLLLLRQTRLAAWAQWLVALGCVLFAGVYFVFDRRYSSFLTNLLTVGAALLIAMLFALSGRFLRTISDGSEN